LNTSLTEAFCIAIVEAACCGYVFTVNLDKQSLFVVANYLLQFKVCLR